MTTKAKKAVKTEKKTDHLVVVARAGTGKTFTIFKGIARCFDLVEKGIVPSPQQQAVWDALSEGRKPMTVLQVAFNKSIVEEATEKYADLIDQLAEQGTVLSISTIHSAGFALVRSINRKARVDKYKLSNTLEKITGMSLWDMGKHKDYGFELTNVLKKLVDLVRLNLTEYEQDKKGNVTFSDEVLIPLCRHYDLPAGEMSGKQWETTKELLGEVISDYLVNTDKIDFVDMIWLPVALDVKCQKHSLVCVDEAQDLSPCQRECVLRMGHRFLFVGDDKQAIYGFAGAATDSIHQIINRLGETDRDVQVLPLTVTRRCGKEIVKKARMIVPDFEAHQDNSEGAIIHSNTVMDAKGGDMILCRTNAPLGRAVWKFIQAGRKAVIRGQDLGEEMLRLCRKMKANDMKSLVEKINEHFCKLKDKVDGSSPADEMYLATLEDKQDLYLSILSGVENINSLESAVKAVFTDDRDPEAVMLSSIHKAKGLESKRVYILHPELLPHPMAKTGWQIEQERNLEYVAITRAMNTLVYV